MDLLKKMKIALKVLRQGGFKALFRFLAWRVQYLNSLPPRLKWKLGVSSEVEFWDSYFKTRGLNKPFISQNSDFLPNPRQKDFEAHFDPDLPLQQRVAALLPPKTEIHILDVGAGPLTSLGKKCAGKHLTITAVDPLGDEYNKLLSKYQISPLIRTEKLSGENLFQRFLPDTFDLVFARNSLDHSFDPVKAILQMVRVVKHGCYVLLEHRQNEAQRQDYYGLHQWDFSISPNGDLLIGSMSREININKKCAEFCAIKSELLELEKGIPWVVTRIQKK